MNTNGECSAEELQQKQPTGWPYLLFAAVLEKELAPLLGGYVALQWATPAKARRLTALESMEFAHGKLDELLAAVPRLTKLLDEEIARAWGASGQPADALAICQVCQQIAACCEGFLVWEKALCSVEPHPLLHDCYTRLRGATRPWVERVAELSARIRNPIAEGQVGELELNLRFDTPSLQDLNLPSLEECRRGARTPPQPTSPKVIFESESSGSGGWNSFVEGVRGCLWVCVLIAAAVALFIAHPVIGTFVCLFLALAGRK